MALVFYGAMHLSVPLLFAVGLYRQRWKQAYGLMLLGIFIDLDYLIAMPTLGFYECPIGVRPFHGIAATMVYSYFLVFPKTRIVAIGLLIHVALDALQCLYL